MTPRRYYSKCESRQRFWQLTSVFSALGHLTCYTKQYSENDHRVIEGCDNTDKYQEVMAWYRGPAWLVNRAWAFHATKAFNGWDFSIRQYNVIPSDSLVFKYAQIGNNLGLQELFERGEASPFDCDERGWTALHV
jgi:hypothetical protein